MSLGMSAELTAPESRNLCGCNGDLTAPPRHRAIFIYILKMPEFLAIEAR